MVSSSLYCTVVMNITKGLEYRAIFVIIYVIIEFFAVEVYFLILILIYFLKSMLIFYLHCIKNKITDIIVSLAFNQLTTHNNYVISNQLN